MTDTTSPKTSDLIDNAQRDYFYRLMLLCRDDIGYYTEARGLIAVAREYYESLVNEELDQVECAQKAAAFRDTEDALDSNADLSKRCPERGSLNTAVAVILRDMQAVADTMGQGFELGSEQRVRICDEFTLLLVSGSSALETGDRGRRV